MNIGIYFDQPNKLDYPLNIQRYFEAYAFFTQYCLSQGVTVYIVRGDSYKGSMSFSSGWQYQGMELLDIDHEIGIDLIYIKGLNFTFTPTEGDLIMDDPEFDRMTGDKWEMYTILKDVMPKTILLDSKWDKVMDQIPGDIVVVKPIAGSGGEGIQFLRKDEIEKSDVPFDGSHIAQEFLETASGIPGTNFGVHDLRLLVFGNTLALSYVRTPAEGKLVANLAQGGEAHVFPLEKVPREVISQAEKVIKQFVDVSPKLYSIDFVFSKGISYVIEINTRPGIPHPEVHGSDFAQTFYTLLLGTMKKAIVEHSVS